MLSAQMAPTLCVMQVYSVVAVLYVTNGAKFVCDEDSCSTIRYRASFFGGGEGESGLI